VTDFRIASDEWERWRDAQPAHVVRGVETDGATGLDVMLVELERTGEHVLLGRHFPMPARPGRPVEVREFSPPEGWDGRAPIAEAQLRFRSGAGLYATPEECPVVSARQREKRRRGWQW